MTEPSTLFARLLGDVRLRLRLDVPVVARDTKIDPKTIYDAESGKRWPRVDTVGKLLAYYAQKDPLTDAALAELLRAAGVKS